MRFPFGPGCRLVRCTYPTSSTVVGKEKETQISRESRGPAALLFVFFCILLVFLCSLESVVEFQFPSRFCNGALELRFPWRFLSSCVLVFRMDAVEVRPKHSSDPALRVFNRVWSATLLPPLYHYSAVEIGVSGGNRFGCVPCPVRQAFFRLGLRGRGLELPLGPCSCSRAVVDLGAVAVTAKVT